ncbi:MAG: hypothetical protein WCE58_03190 [Gallionella sp.]
MSKNIFRPSRAIADKEVLEDVAVADDADVDVVASARERLSAQAGSTAANNMQMRQGTMPVVAWVNNLGMLIVYFMMILFCPDSRLPDRC